METRDLISLVVSVRGAQHRAEAATPARFGAEAVFSSDLSMPMAAVWEVFTPVQAQQLAAWLAMNDAWLHTSALAAAELSAAQRSGAPLANGAYLLGEVALSRLARDTGIVPCRVEQRAGDAVIVPAGSPFQVRHVATHLRASTYFMAPESASSAAAAAEMAARPPGACGAGTGGCGDAYGVRRLLVHAAAALLPALGTTILGSAGISPADAQAAGGGAASSGATPSSVGGGSVSAGGPVRGTREQQAGVQMFSLADAAAAAMPLLSTMSKEQLRSIIASPEVASLAASLLPRAADAVGTATGPDGNPITAAQLAAAASTAAAASGIAAAVANAAAAAGGLPPPARAAGAQTASRGGSGGAPRVGAKPGCGGSAPSARPRRTPQWTPDWRHP